MTPNFHAPIRWRHRPNAIRFLASFAAVAALTIGATALSASAATGVVKKSSGTIHVPGVPKGAIPSGKTPNLHGLSVTIEDQGSPDPSRITDYEVVHLLKSWGANAKLIFAPSQQVATSSLLSGAANVLFSTIPNQLPTVVSGFNIRIFGINNPRLDYALLGTGSITSIAQLKGQNIGVLTGGPGDITWVLTKQALESVGLSLSDINLVKTGGQTVREAALASGRVQATVVGHNGLYVLRTLSPHILYDFTVKDPTLNNDFLWASPSWITQHAKMAVAINLAELDTYQWFNNPKNENAVLVTMVGDSPGATMSSARSIYNLYRKYGVLAAGSALSTKALLAQQSFYQSAGTLTTALPLSSWALPVYDEAALQVYNRNNGITSSKKS